jgi:hypothetical protein
MISRMGRRSLLTLAVYSALVLASTGGCLHRQLEFTAHRTLSRLPELQYQQVVDNLAAVAANPAHLPYLAVVGQGAIQVTDNGTSTLGLTIPMISSKPYGLNIGTTRNVTGTLSLGTITSPDKIRAMQAVYQRAVAGSARREPEHLWLKVGTKREVPRGARYSGQHGDVWVWVMLAILDIATREDDADTGVVPDRGGRRGGVPRRNFQVPASGPVFTPGGTG